MKRILMLLCICLSVLLTSCTPKEGYIVNTGLVVAESAALQIQHKQLAALLIEKQKQEHVFTDHEWEQLTTVNTDINTLLYRLLSLGDLDSQTLVTLLTMEEMWQTITISYISASNVVQVHWAAFTPEQQLLLSTFDIQANTLSTRINILLDNPTAANISQSLSLISSMAGLTNKMIYTAIE